MLIFGAFSTLDKAYTQLLVSMSDTAQDHINLADAFNSQVIDPLKATERKHDDARKRQMQYYQKLLADRDRVYSDRAKVCAVSHEMPSWISG